MTNGSQKRKARAVNKEREAEAPAAPKAASPVVKTGVQTWTVTEDEGGMRLDRWFRRRVPAMGLSHLNKIVRKGEVRVDGARVESAHRLAVGSKVRVPPLEVASFSAPAIRRASPDDVRAIQNMVLFEDRDLMALDKPFGLAVQGGSGTKHHLDGMLMSMANERGERPVLVHRLDRDTSGVLLIAKNRKTAADLGELFRSRRAQKIYWALVEGVPKPSQGRISLYLAKGAGMGNDRSSSGRRMPERDERKTNRPDLEKMRVAKHGEDDAQHSLTYYSIVDKVAPRCAWLSMKPLTGRTHQLRAHAQAIGHPIVGDPKYNEVELSGVRRQDPLRAMPDAVEHKLHLLARRLVLPHPRGGMIDVTAPLPQHMRDTWDLFGFDEKQYDPIVDAPDE